MILGTWIHACSVQMFWNLRDARKFVELYLKFHERRLLFAYMESSIRTYPGLSKTLYLACKTR